MIINRRRIQIDFYQLKIVLIDLKNEIAYLSLCKMREHDCFGSKISQGRYKCTHN